MNEIRWQDYLPLFEESEFICKCGCGQCDMQKDHMDMLFKARIRASIPFIVNSGFRCAWHNNNEGGSVTSDHLTGYGTDIQAKSGRARWIIFNALLSVGFNRIGIGRTFIHAGSDPANPEKVIWAY